jgi:DNA invertase Pin-like site-specific DNA recombinase
MPIAYSYRRFSSEKQSKGDSLRRQTELAERYIESNPHLGLVLDESMDLTDLGMSAYKGTHEKRGALGVFLRKVEDGLIEEGSFLLVESLDRLSRAQPAQALPSLIDLVNSGITVVTLTDHKTYSQETIAGTDGTFVLMQSLVTMARAFEESETKGKRVRAAWQNKFNRITEGAQLTRKTPFWLTEQRELKASESEILREIFQLYANGMGSYSIARLLNERKVPPPTKRGSYWSFSTINKLLTSKTVLGVLTTADGREHEGYYPQAISYETWNECQRLRPSGKRTASKMAAAPLSGLFRCALCGSTVKKAIKTGRVRKDGTRNRWETLVCSRATTNAGCVYIGLSHRLVLDTVLMMLRDIEFTATTEDNFAGRIKNLELGISVLEDELQDAYDAFKATKTIYSRQRYQQIDSEVSEAKRDLATMKANFEAIPLAVQDAALVRIFSSRQPTNADLRKVIREGKIDFVERSVTFQTHLMSEFKEQLDTFTDLSDAL